MDQTRVIYLHVGSLCHFTISMWRSVLCYKTLQCFVYLKIPSHITYHKDDDQYCDEIDSYLPATATPARSKASTEKNFLLPGLSLFPPDLSLLLQTSSSKEWSTFSLTEDLKRGATSLKTRPRLFCLQENGFIPFNGVLTCAGWDIITRVKRNVIL